MFNKKIIFLTFYLFFVAIITSACGSGKTNTNTQYVPVPVVSPTPEVIPMPDPSPTPETKYPLELSSTKFTINVGETDNLAVTLNGEDVTATVTYSVDEEAIARVEQGIITGLSAGVTLVTVHDDNAESDKTFVVNVIDPNIPTLELSQETVSLVVGATEYITVTLDGTPITEEVSYDVKDDSVAKVEKGKITALGEGSTSVTVSFVGANSAVFTLDVTIENPFVGFEVGDIVKFGRYPQTANGEIMPIEWRVLHKDNNRLLVVSEYGLDCLPFYGIGGSNDWASSTVCMWLNTRFYNIAFTSAEQGFINSTELLDVDPSGGTYKVFLLSGEYNSNTGEVYDYFDSDEARKCVATDYAKSMGAYVSSAGISNGCSHWWLRSPIPKAVYSDDYYVYIGHISGSVRGDNVDVTNNVVRPALWINLE